MPPSTENKNCSSVSSRNTFGLPASSRENIVKSDVKIFYNVKSDVKLFYIVKSDVTLFYNVKSDVKLFYNVKVHCKTFYVVNSILHRKNAVNPFYIVKSIVKFTDLQKLLPVLSSSRRIQKLLPVLRVALNVFVAKFSGIYLTERHRL